MLYLFKVENPIGGNIEMIISADNKDTAISLLLKELNHTKHSFLKTTEKEFNYILKRFESEKDYFIRKGNEKCLCVGNFNFSYNDYLSDKEKFKETFFKEHKNYYYQPKRSLSYNLDHHIFKIINLSEVDDNKNKVINKTFIYCGR